MDKPPVYQKKRTTISIAGKTNPLKAAQSAIRFIGDGKLPEFLYIGGNAGQQAMKSMGILRFQFDQQNEGRSLAFQPYRVLCLTKHPITEEEKEKDGVVWKTVIISQKEEDKNEFAPKQESVG